MESLLRVSGLLDDVDATVSQKPNSDSDGELSFVGTSLQARPQFSTPGGLDVESKRFSNELAERILGRIVVATLSGATKSCTQTQPRSNSSESHLTVQSTSQSLSSKRARQKDSSDDNTEDAGDDDEESRLPPVKRNRGNEDKQVKLFACPYSKFDTERYSERNSCEKNYRKCASSVLSSIARLKQHLYRTHKRPDYYCGSCFQKFKARDDLHKHNRARPPCEISATKYGE
jgi:hypothetical protein